MLSFRLYVPACAIERARDRFESLAADLRAFIETQV